MGALDWVARICTRDLDERALRVALLMELRRVIPCSSHAWLLTDPQTCVGSVPVASVPSMADLPTLIRLKYLTTTNRWTTLPAGTATTLLKASDGQPSRSRVWAELLSGYGVLDIASSVFADRHGCWSFLDLWRTDRPFSPTETDLLAEFTSLVTPVLRSRLAATLAIEPIARFPSGEPVVLLLTSKLEQLTQTDQVDAFLRTLLPTRAAAAPVPAAAYNVAAQLLAREAGVDDHPPSARAHLGGGLWVTLSAAFLGERGAQSSLIAVTIEPLPPEQRCDLFGRVIGLSQRESELLTHLVTGADTRQLAQRMSVSEHTVQDHLKSVFAKAGVNNRRALVARATGTSLRPTGGLAR